jgi:hypothetical protein
VICPARVRRECRKGIGVLTLGVCRHRAALFKYCAGCFSAAVTRNGGSADASSASLMQRGINCCVARHHLRTCFPFCVTTIPGAETAC